ncbi:MAG: cobalamin B12-binding domain-containing protein [Thermoplasmata archaeon]
MKILGAAVGNCVHVAGVQAFLDIARTLGHDTVFLGPAVPIKRLVASIRDHRPDAVAISYRLSPESANAILTELSSEMMCDPEIRKRKFFFGGTPPVVEIARSTRIFDACFDGSEPESTVISVLKGAPLVKRASELPSNLVARIESSQPMPLIRHHFGLPSLDATVQGVRKIAESGVVDILSIAPDQNAQEWFFRPQEMDPNLHGAGGVPLRSPEHLRAIYEATRTGSYPLLRCYSGTNDLVRWAEMLMETIDIAWGAVPLMWYSELDGRSKRSLEKAIAENQAAIRWYAGHDIPVEVNESHQWALRRSGDVIELATAYLAAYNAKSLGVRSYVCQFMFDTPKGISPAMDLAKMLAKLELVESLAGTEFRIIRMVRSGLAFFSPSPSTAKGQLAASVYTAMALKPHIVHVVGYSEADHAALPEEVIESSEIARGAVMKALLGTTRPDTDPRVMARKAELLDEAKFLVDAIKRLKRGNSDDPLTSPATLAQAVREGLLDASDLKGSKVARGKIVTAILEGACVAVAPSSGKPITEKERIHDLAVSEEDLDLAEI